MTAADNHFAAFIDNVRRELNFTKTGRRNIIQGPEGTHLRLTLSDGLLLVAVHGKKASLGMDRKRTVGLPVGLEGITAKEAANAIQKNLLGPLTVHVRVSSQQRRLKGAARRAKFEKAEDTRCLHGQLYITRAPVERRPVECLVEIGDGNMPYRMNIGELSEKLALKIVTLIRAETDLPDERYASRRPKQRRLYWRRWI